MSTITPPVTAVGPGTLGPVTGPHIDRSVPQTLLWDIQALPNRLRSVAIMLEMLADSVHVRALRREAEEKRTSGKQDWGRVWIDDWTTDTYHVALDLARLIREASASSEALLPKVKSGTVTQDELAAYEESLNRLHSYLSVLSDSVDTPPHADFCEVITERHFSECVSGVMRLQQHLFGDEIHTS